MAVAAKTGNEAMAEAMRQINPDVVAAYPITPATEIVMIFAQFVADGLVDTEYVPVESEHSAMSACVGAASAGARVMTGTSSQGLAYMYEILPIAAALRLPIVMCEVNRAISGPINIHCDHSDTMAARDFGWIQMFSENAQEAYDNTLQAVRIAETVKLPTMATTDGFIISHCMERIETLEDDQVKDFIGEYKLTPSLLDIENPTTRGALDLQDYYFEHHVGVGEAMKGARSIIKSVAEDFNKKFGRKYDLIEGYKLEDAERVIVALGSTCGTLRAVIDELREKGAKVGLLKIRVFRPFPADEIAKALSNCRSVAVLDRVEPWSGVGSQTFVEVRSALFNLAKKPKLINYMYGLGGRDISLKELAGVYENLKKADSLQEVNYLGVGE
ncbi:pyruvate ferredoxin oxidoreductase [Candidatus Saganbacteria bacterium]|nr:pyruvate ferredoxin oxidoreductase [Candidatus Saganbacteria bacterium]